MKDISLVNSWASCHSSVCAGQLFSVRKIALAFDFIVQKNLSQQLLNTKSIFKFSVISPPKKMQLFANTGKCKDCMLWGREVLDGCFPLCVMKSPEWKELNEHELHKGPTSDPTSWAMAYTLRPAGNVILTCKRFKGTQFIRTKHNIWYLEACRRCDPNV